MSVTNMDGSMPGVSNTHQNFVAALHQDIKLGIVESWMTSWLWKELNPRFGDSQNFNGPIDLVNWFINQSKSRKYHNPDDLHEVLEGANYQKEVETRVFELKIFEPYKNMLSRIDFDNHAIYTAQDYYFQTLKIKEPVGRQKTVLDFGSGCGRTAVPWMKGNDKLFISVEGIPETYCIQNLFYKCINAPLRDYIEHSLDERLDAHRGIVHIPSWRVDLVRSGTVDLVSAVQVLGEVRPEMLDFVLSHFHRVLRRGGRLYVRDHGDKHNPNKVNLKEKIINQGFRLIFEPNYSDKIEIHGIPKIWERL